MNERRILFIFDEIEQITYSTSSTNHWRKQNDSLYFWETIRSIHQTNSKLFSYIVTGVNPKCIEDNKINGTPNPIFGALTPKYIPLFDYNDIRTMVLSIGGYVGLTFEEELYAKLVEDYGGHPFLTRQVCSKINTELLDLKQTRPCVITKNMYDKRSNEFRNQMESVIAQILDVLSTYYPSEYELLKTLALDGNKAFKSNLKLGDNAISHLTGYHLVEIDSENDYYISINSVKEYLKELHKYDISLENDEDKWAQITRRRGAI